MLEAVAAVLLVGVDDRLSVRVGLEAMTAVLELLAEILEVVDLTVEDDADGAVFVVDRLIAAGDVDDGQAAHAQADIVRPEETFAVGTAVQQPVVHRLQRGAIGAQGAQHAGDAAHRYGDRIAGANAQTPTGTFWDKRPSG